MAEMTAKQAIAVLHNNQYQKHIANGEYDYIHPLTDAECKGIESLIQQQQQQIEQLAAEIERLKDLHRSILWFVEEHKKIKNCKKWMPLIEEKAKAALEDKP